MNIFYKPSKEQVEFENAAFGAEAETYQRVVSRKLRRKFYLVWGFHASAIFKTRAIGHLNRNPEFHKVKFLLKYREATCSLIAAMDADKDVAKTIKNYLI